MKKLIIVSIIMIILAGAAIFVFYQRGLEIIKEPIPSAQVYNPSLPILSPTPPELQNRGSSTPTPSGVGTTPNSVAIKAQVNLAIPFTSQAPSKNWGLPYAEFCEEASALMVASYINGWTIPSIEFAEQKMREIQAFEEERFGYYKDTDAEETAIIMREFYKLNKVQVLYDPTINDIKKAVADGKAVLMPAAGRLLGNPYFQSPGPIYHMIVIKGYTKEGNIITNDPGTRNGADFIYSPSVIMDAMHDWNDGDVYNGRKVVIIVG